MKITQRKFYFNFTLFLSVLFIVGIGLLAIYSVSFQDPGFNNFKRQSLFIGISLVVFFAVNAINYGIWEHYARYFYLFGLLLMFLVLIFGLEIQGTSGWFQISSYHLQPVEIMKMGVILILAKYFFKAGKDDKRPKHILISGIICLVPFLLTIMQPDLGSGLVILGIWFVMLINWGVKRHYVALLLLGFVAAAVLSWFFYLKTYQKERLTGFLDPEGDPSGSGYHVLQSMTAIGSGGLSGKGLGHGSQSQLHFLPEAHTDFIYATIGEELGFSGTFLLMLGFLYLFYQLYKVAFTSTDNFGRYIVEGVMAMFAIQLLVNIGMNIGIFPVIGLPLPLVSYGGSALVVEFFLLGLVSNIYSASRRSQSSLTSNEVMLENRPNPRVYI
ncbi:MAG: rod shape-determining protein RodA [Candidatus Moranbacteria bacterium]|nr:rod shape-determining protein RodA [Candidatus Moranbacteria bacterium]